MKEDVKLEEAINELLEEKEDINYYFEPKSNTPSWIEYWGLKKEKANNWNALIFQYIENRWFVFSYGHAYHKLKSDSYEPDFGFIVSLNLIEKGKIKKIDKADFEKGKVSKETSTKKNTEFNSYNFNIYTQLLQNIQGKVDKNKNDMLSMVGGSNKLKITLKKVISREEIPSLCSFLLKTYSDESYKKDYPDLLKINRIKDKTIIASLDNKLIEEMNKRQDEIIIYSYEIETENFIGYSLVKKNKSIEEINDYYETLTTDITIESLKKVKLTIETENAKKYPVSFYKTLNFHTDLDNKIYYLYNGEWFNIDTDFYSNVKQTLDDCYKEHGKFITFDEKEIKDKYLLLNESKDGIQWEDTYNKSIVEKYPELMLLDKNNINVGNNKIEICDLYTVDENGHAVFYHVKKAKNSAVLSHLFAQGIISAQSISNNSKFLDQAKQKIKEIMPEDSKKDKYIKALDNDEPKKIVYIILYQKERKKDRTITDFIPYMSQLGLYNHIDVAKKTTRLGVEWYCPEYIKDNTEAATKSPTIN